MMLPTKITAVLLLLEISPLSVNAFTSSYYSNVVSQTRPNSADMNIKTLCMATRHSRQSVFPSIFPGQSAAHNFHEFVLGVLVNSNGQNVLSKQTLGVQRKKSASTTSQSIAPRATVSQQRTVNKVERFERIPIWPTSNGLRFKSISRFNPDLAAKLEHQYGGADSPNLWLTDTASCSPFLMMCHHNHSFRLNDPVRLIQKNIIPEGFPSHGHAGMTTLTICLRGGLVHRDSLGNKQLFGADRHDYQQQQQLVTNNAYKGKHTQWLTFGKGAIHELMWDNEPNKKSQYGRKDNGSVIHQEIYQIWIDLPQKKRYMEPRVELLGGDEETPSVINADGCKTTIFAGEHAGASASVDTVSDLAILRVEMNSHKVWSHQPPSSHSTIIVYVRTGSVIVGNTQVPPHCTAYLSSTEKGLTIKSEENGADFLVMAGSPLNQKVSARGSMVVQTPEDLKQAFRDYERGDMGVPWNEKCTDEQWRTHLEKTKH